MRFTEILFALTLISGLIWLIDVLFLKPNRLMRILPNGKGQVKEPIIVEYAKGFFPVLLIVLLVRSFIIEPFRIPSASMRPTLLEGDFILVNKYIYGLRMPFSGKTFFDISEPKRGDVIVFKHIKRDESIDMIKRVVGLPSDHIQYKDKMVYVNGNPIKQQFIEEKEDQEPYGRPSQRVRHHSEILGNIHHDIYLNNNLSSSPTYDDIIVPEKSYFVMGDNRDNSDDSRSWGFVNNEDILGKAVMIWMSWDGSKTGMDCVKECIRWNRMGRKLGEEVDVNGKGFDVKEKESLKMEEKTETEMLNEKLGSDKINGKEKSKKLNGKTESTEELPPGEKNSNAQ